MIGIKGNELIEKRNVLNEIRSSSMTLQELRFFSIYLSKINARDKSTRVVRFPLSDFQKIMELGRMNIQHMKQTTDGLLTKVVNIKNERVIQRVYCRSRRIWRMVCRNRRSRQSITSYVRF